MYSEDNDSRDRGSDKDYQPHGPLSADRHVPLQGVHKEHMALLATQSSWDEHSYKTSHLMQEFTFEEGKEFIAGKKNHKTSKVMQSPSASVDSQQAVSEPIRMEEGRFLAIKVPLTHPQTQTQHGVSPLFKPTLFLLACVFLVALGYFLYLKFK